MSAVAATMSAAICGIVERARQAQAGFVEACDGIVGEERIGAAYQGQVLA